MKTSTKRPDPKLEEFALMVQDMRRKQRKLRDGSASPSRTFRSELADLERRVDVLAEKILSPSLPFLEATNEPAD